MIYTKNKMELLILSAGLLFSTQLLAADQEASLEMSGNTVQESVQNLGGDAEKFNTLEKRPKFNTWSTFTQTFAKDPYPGAPNTSNTSLVNLGGDYKFASLWNAGLSYGYSRGRIKTPSTSGLIRSSTNIIAPYISYTPTNYMSFQLAGGRAYGHLNLSQQNQGVYVTGRTSSYADFFAFVTQFHKKYGKFRTSLRFAYTYYDSIVKAFSFSDGSSISQGRMYTGNLNVTGQLLYHASDTIHPFIQGGPQWNPNYPSNYIQKSGLGYSIGCGASAAYSKSLKFVATYDYIKTPTKVDENRFMFKGNYTF